MKNHVIVELGPMRLLGTRSAKTEQSEPGDASAKVQEPPGQRLARFASAWAKSQKGTHGFCASSVKNILWDAMGIPRVDLPGDAYQVADALAALSHTFREIKGVPNLPIQPEMRALLRELPPGSIIVYGKSQKKKVGHIGIRSPEIVINTRGKKNWNSLEASDTLRDVGRTNDYGPVRVFFPLGSDEDKIESWASLAAKAAKENTFSSRH